MGFKTKRNTIVKIVYSLKKVPIIKLKKIIQIFPLFFPQRTEW